MERIGGPCVMVLDAAMRPRFEVARVALESSGDDSISSGGGGGGASSGGGGGANSGGGGGTSGSGGCSGTPGLERGGQTCPQPGFSSNEGLGNWPHRRIICVTVIILYFAAGVYNVLWLAYSMRKSSLLSSLFHISCALVALVVVCVAAHCLRSWRQEEERELLLGAGQRQNTARAEQAQEGVGGPPAAGPAAVTERERQQQEGRGGVDAPRAGAARAPAALVSEEAPAGGCPLLAAGAGNTADSAGGGAGGEARGGLDGLCCVCMDRRAVAGFMHADVVHCCLCGECEGEMRRRGGLARCLMCKRPAAAVCRVIAT
ncbi:hypothetical protein TSOC_002025 [Tetrabaena socialis]|uniref:Uncharacterized protein n=1 Tax=Tetrabaena socialis TaxID=47790 RepID=A0A2J8AF77_9CHLO|nr:hypothetical protein TSOC_002025 [Tetrabaena socialis]|eukprot:PNH11183.1 hypothetical protein TSOC_002025 [Tetrabaena socialis]